MEIFKEKESELIRCPKCRRWIECVELADYFCAECRREEVKPAKKRVDEFLEKFNPDF